ncbi:unnamed protein product [Anisakis simplex]|uniref:ZP domain-containing protein n=1 Tax=Anisakis simplex TaxID=6269 RepID=A0A0M3K6C1_ANISI|nr:unnamed protein product [Anisakis simplex]
MHSSLLDATSARSTLYSSQMAFGCYAFKVSYCTDDSVWYESIYLVISNDDCDDIQCTAVLQYDCWSHIRIFPFDTFSRSSTEESRYWWRLLLLMIVM